MSTSRTGDEGWLMRTAHEVVSTGRWDSYDSIRHPPLSFYTYGFFLSDSRDARGNLRLARSLMLLYPLVLGIALYGFTRRLAGRAAAFAAVLLMVTDPNFLAHSALITTDVCAACTFFLAFVSGVSAIGRGSARAALPAGLCLGLALLAKYTGILLLALLPIVALLPAWPARGETVRDGAPRATPESSRAPATLARRFRCLAFLFAVALFVLHAGYGFMQPMGAEYCARSHFGQWLVFSNHTLPLVPAPYIMGLDRVMEVMELGHPAFFHGEFFLKNKWFFYPASFVWKEPVILLGLMGWGLLALVRRKGRRRLLLPVAIPLASFMFLNNNFVGIRHLLVISPFLYLIASLAWENTARIRYVLFSLLVLQLIVTFHAAPHYLSFFNALTQGPEHGDRYLLDSNYDWGQDYDAFLEKKENSSDLIKDSPGPYPTLGRVAVSAMDYRGYPGTWEGHPWLSGFPVAERVGFTWRIYDPELGDFEKNVDPGNPKTDEALAWALHESGRSDEALRIFRKVYDAYGEALILLEQRKWEEALRACEAAEGINGSDACEAAEKIDGADTCVTAAVSNTSCVCERTEDKASLLALHASILDELGRSGEAEAMFLKSTAASVERSYLGGAPSMNMEDYADPKNALHLNNAGYLLWREGRLEEAAYRFRLATEEDPLFADPWGNLAAVSAHLCERELLRELEESRTDTENRVVSKDRADAGDRAASGDRDDTVDRAASNDQVDADTRTKSHGQADAENPTAGKDRRTRRASYAAAALSFRATYLKLITLPGAWWAKRVDYRGHVAVYPGIFALPLPGPRALELLAENRPLNVDDLRNLGKRRLLDKDALHAARAFLSVLREREDDAVSLYHLGVIRFHQRLYANAERRLEAALSIDPEYVRAREALTYMKAYLKP